MSAYTAANLRVNLLKTFGPVTLHIGVLLCA